MIEDLDPVIHAPKRLAAMAILANAPAATFQFLKAELELADPDLSKQMRALETAGYVDVAKAGRGRRGVSTSYSLTRPGRAAYERHVGALRALIDGGG